MVEQGGGRHDGKRRTDHQQQVRLGGDLAGIRKMWHGLAEPHHVGAQLTALVAEVPQADSHAGL